MARPPGHGPGYEIRREEIIDTAAALFAKKGYAATGIAEICDAANMARSGLYYYIGSKEKLLVEIQNRVMQPMLTMGHRIAGVDEAPMLRLRMLSQMLLEHILMWLDHVWVYEHDYRNLRGANRRLLLEQRREFEDIVQELLTAAMDDGSIRKTDPRLATLQFLNMHNHTYQWVDPRGEWDAAHLSREYCTTLFSGLSTSTYQVGDLEDRMAEVVTRREDFTTAPRTRRSRKR